MESESRFLVSHPSTAGQSLHEMGVHVRLSVSESYRNGRTAHPDPGVGKVGGGGFTKPFDHPASSSDRVRLAALASFK